MMWQTHGPRHRTLLTVAGILLTTAGGALIFWNKLVPAGPTASARVDELIPWPGQLGALGLLIIAALLTLTCLWVIISAMPRKPPIRTFRYTNTAGANTLIKTEVIARAGQQSAESSGLITTARIRISGSTESPTLYATFTVRNDRPFPEALELVNGRLIPDMESVIGAAFQERHIRYDVSDEHTKSTGSLDLTSLPRESHAEPMGPPKQTLATGR